MNYPRPPFPSQQQPMPGATGAMTPVPDRGETTYKGCDRLRGRNGYRGRRQRHRPRRRLAFAREGADVLTS
jgi:hypothetical protein